MDKEVEKIVSCLDRKKMQARQIFPNSMVVPYQRAKKAIDQIVEYYEKRLKNVRTETDSQQVAGKLPAN